MDCLVASLLGMTDGREEEGGSETAPYAERNSQV